MSRYKEGLGKDTIKCFELTKSGRINELRESLANTEKKWDTDGVGDMILHIATIQNFTGENLEKVLDTIMEFNPPLEMKNERGHTPLACACFNGNLAAVKKFVSFGADLESLNGLSQKTPLMLAVECNHKDIVTELLKNGANVFACSEEGKTPMDYALTAWSGSNQEIIEQIKAAEEKMCLSADIKKVNSNGKKIKV